MRIWIHGAFATPQSFNYLRTQMRPADDIMISYDCNSNLIETIRHIYEHVESKSNGQPVDLIGHSLGGVFCVILHHSGLPTRSINTLCAPFGGLDSNFIMKWWFPTFYPQIYNLQNKYNHLLTNPVKVPHQFFVATEGHNPLFLGKPNDCVVTVRSQTVIPNANYIYIPSNHYEILVNNDVVDEINKLYRSL